MPCSCWRRSWPVLVWPRLYTLCSTDLIEILHQKDHPGVVMYSDDMATLSPGVTVKLAYRAQPTVDGPADLTLRWREEIVANKTQTLLMTQRRREWWQLALMVDAGRANGVTSNSVCGSLHFRDDSHCLWRKAPSPRTARLVRTTATAPGGSPPPGRPGW